MKSIFCYVSLALTLFMSISCKDDPSLQEYYVENSENSDFIVIDVPASVIDLSGIELSPQQQSAYQSIRKLNILAFKRTGANVANYEIEKNKVKTILNQPQYNELMAFNTGKRRGAVKFLGTDEAIDELVIFGSDNERGFFLARVLGNNMKPENMAQLMQALPKAKLQGDDFKALEGMFGK